MGVEPGAEAEGEPQVEAEEAGEEVGEAETGMIETVSEDGKPKQAPFKPEYVLGPKYSKIATSQIDNFAVLPESYIGRPVNEEIEAVKNRLEEMKSEYPLDLISLLRRKGHDISVERLRSNWLRIINYDTPNSLALAQMVERMIVEDCFERCITGSQQAEFVINLACTYEPMRRVLKLQDGVFLKRYLSDKVVVGLLEKIAANKIPARNLELLRYFSRVTNVNRSVSGLTVNGTTLRKVLRLPETEAISKLEVYYCLMQIAPQEIRNSFNLKKFVVELTKISYSREEDKQAQTAQKISELVEGMNAVRPLQYLLAEVFFTSVNFKQAVTNVYAVLALLERVVSLANMTVQTSISEVIERMEAPSEEWAQNIFEKLLPSVLEGLSKPLYNAYVQLYNEYLYTKQNSTELSTTGEFTLKLSDYLFVNGQSVPEPIIHETFELLEEKKSKFHNKQRMLKRQSSDPESLPKESGYLPKVNRLDVLLEATLAGDLTPHIEEMMAFFRQHDQDAEKELRNIFEELPNTIEYQEVVASSKGEERRKKLAILYLRAVSDVIDGSQTKVTLRDVLTSRAAKRNRWLLKQQAQEANEALQEGEAETQQIMIEEVEPLLEAEIEPGAEGEGVAQAEGEATAPAEGEVEEASAEGVQGTQTAEVLPPPAKKEPELRLNRFQKKGFSTKKNIAEAIEADRQTEPKQDGLASYLKVLKDVDQTVATQTATMKPRQEHEEDNQISTGGNHLLQAIEASKNLQEACKHVFAYISENRSASCFDELIKEKEIRFFKNGEHLLLGMFYHAEVSPRPIKSHSDKLVCSFDTELGQMQKDYNKYLNVATCAFDFALSPESYKVILKDLYRTYSRRYLKRTIAHISQYCTSLPDDIVKLICDLCDRERVAFTALEFAQLLLQNKVTISQDAFVTIVRVLKNYKDISDEVPNLYRRYLLANSWEPSPEPIEAYIGNLVKANAADKLTKAVEMIKELAAPQKYRFQESLSASENAKRENEHKEVMKQETRKTAYQLASVCARYGEAEHAESLFNFYIENRKELNDKDLALGYMCYSNNAEKYHELLEMQAKRPITPEQFQSAIKALELRPRILHNEIDRVLDIMVYDQKLYLPEPTIVQIVKIIRRSDNLLLFSRFLEHILRTQPPLSTETKRLFYRILNQTKEDAGKNYIKGLLDILFEKERKEERLKYKETWEAEQVKKTKLDQMKKEALAKNEERKRAEEKEEAELLAKHGLLKKQPDNQDKALVESKQEGKKGKKQKQELEPKPVKNEIVAKDASNPEAKQDAASKTDANKEATAARGDATKKSGKSAKKESADKRKPEIKPKSQAKPAAQPERQDLIDLNEKKKINSKAIRRGGRNKFFDMAMSEEQMEEEENLSKKKRGGRK